MNGMFRGSPRLLVRSLPWAIGLVVLKALAEMFDLQPFALSPLLAGALAAEVFIIGFLLTGTASDFKEAERLPGEVAASIETMADECLLIRKELRLPEAEMCLADLLALGRSIRSWLAHDRGFDDVMADLRQLNDYFLVFGSKIQAGFTTRLKSEQSSIRKVVIRMDTMRRTSYVAAGYLIAEVIAVLLFAIMVLTDLGDSAPTLALVGLVGYLIIYVLGLIRDLDNPFEYPNGKPGAADVSLDVLERHDARMVALLAAGRGAIEHAEELAGVTHIDPAATETA